VQILPAAPLDAGGGGAGDHVYAASVPPPQPRPPPEPEAAPMTRPTTKKRRRHQGGDEQGDGASAAADLGGATTALLVNTIVGLKADMRAMTAKMKKMEKKLKKQKKKKQYNNNNNIDVVVVELQRRVEQLEEDNVQLRIQLAHVAASRYGVAATNAGFFAAPPPSSSSSFSCAQQRLRVGDNGQPGPEMLWCFPFLQHYDIPADRFVVDDIQYLLLSRCVFTHSPTHSLTHSLTLTWLRARFNSSPFGSLV
jgi:cellobiose-specific phosphotransferase system component IIB